MDLDALLTVADIEHAARALLDDQTWAYVSGGAGSGSTVHANTRAFDGVYLRPRILRTPCAGTPDTAVTLFGQVLSMPVLLAPTSPQRLLHHDAELASATAAAEAGTVSIVSTDSQQSFPAIAAAAQKSCWFQLYPYRSRVDVEALIAMAQEAGAQAIVVTVDAQHPARRVSAARAGFRAPPQLDFGTLRALHILDGEVPADARMDRLPLTWTDLDDIRRRTSIPLLVKGVLHPGDARRCVEAGADGIVVSNHGGRQLDAAVPSLVALRQIAGEVRGDCVVLVDGGIRSGVDVVKALALGADAVCIGRPYLWGLAVAGKAGVGRVLTLLHDELQDTMRQLGTGSVGVLSPDCVLDS